MSSGRRGLDEQVTYPVDQDGFKVCAKCGERQLAIMAFSLTRTGRFRAQCKRCRSGMLKAWRHRERPSERQTFYAEALRLFSEDD